MHQGRLDPARLVVIDETWAKTNMTRLRGWAPRGHKLLAKVPHGHWRTLTFLAALRHDRIDAPFVLDGPINGQSFLACVEQVLVGMIADVTFDEFPTGRHRPSEASRQVVNDNHILARIEQSQNHVTADITRATCDQHAHPKGLKSPTYTLKGRERASGGLGRSPRQRRETRHIGEVIRVERDQGRAVHQSLSRDHPVEQFPPRVASACDNGPVDLRRKIIERQRWNSAQHGVEPRPANGRVGRLPIDAALQLHACDN